MAQTKAPVAMCLTKYTEVTAANEFLYGGNWVTCKKPDGVAGVLGWKQVFVSDQEIVTTAPTSPTTSSSCALADGSGNNAWCELGNMSMADAQVISAYVGLVWAIAFGFKALRKAVILKGSEE